MKTGGEGGGGFFGKRGFFWKLLASGMMPIIMAAAYAFMAATSESDNTAKAWMGTAFLFVLVVWWIFRITTSTAALARAMSVGDPERILELVPAKSKTASARMQRAFAYEMRGSWAEAIESAATVREAPRATPDVIGAAAAVRVGALVESGDAAGARAVYDAELARALVTPGSHHELARSARLASGRVAWAEGDLDAASVAIERVMRDVRSGAAARAIAHAYAARIAEARGDVTAATTHRAEAARLAPGSWMATAAER